jgi:uncharacterized protein (TIGR00369 family)
VACDDDEDDEGDPVEIDPRAREDRPTPVLERLRAAARDHRPVVPAHARMNAVMAFAEVGHCGTQLHNGSLLRDAAGRLAVGALLVPVDGALSLPVMTALPLGRRGVTLHMRVSTVSTKLPATGPLLAQARLHSLTAGSGSTVGDVVDATGATIARISARCAVLDGHPRLAAERSAFTGIEPARSVTEALGITVQRLDGERAEMTARPVPELANADALLQGGALGAFAEHALSRTITAASPALAEADAQELELTFFRGVPVDGGLITCRTTVQHAGRRMAGARAEVVDQTGRTAMVATAYRYADGQ